jgi:capsular exopolysaccharide synthesis family protein
MATYQTRKAEQERDRDAVEQYTKELDNMDQMARSATFSSLDWAQYPIEPDAPTFPNMGMTMTVSVMIGLVLSLGIAFLRELADTTVRSPRDIQRVGQMNLLGMVPHEADDPQAAGARLPLVIFEAPHSMMAEQLRQVRTRLQHAASLDTTRSILVTSPSPGDGKSTVAVNLAAGLALNGRRILLVDANFRRPELHRIFGIGNELGFSDVLNDVNAFATAVKDTPVPNLSVMCTGPRPSNPTELLESQLLLDFIERCLEEYDHVIFDSGPMLFVSDSVALAPRVDGVVTVVRARANTRGVLTRMRDALRSVKAEHLGVVLNGVRSQAGGYYGRSIKTYYAYQNDG